MSAERRPTSIYHLSQELIDEIIDILAFSTRHQWKDHWACLSSCALVSRSFLPRSQTHLFSRIALMDDSNDDIRDNRGRIKPFLDILEGRPSIARHVQELQLVVLYGQSSWLYEKPDVTKLLGLISTSEIPIKRLMLAEKRRCGDYLRKPLLMMERSLLCNIVPYITSLSFKLLKHIPPELVAMCPNLHELHLTYSDFLEVEDVQTPSQSRPHLRSLSYAVDHPDLGLAALFKERYLDIAGISSLIAYVDNRVGDFDFEQKIINDCKSSLEEVIIEVHDHHQSKHPVYIQTTALNLKSLEKLHTLSLVAFITKSSRSQTTEGLSDICSTLRSLSRSKSRLKNLNIVLHVMDKLDKLNQADWEGLYAAIMDVSVFSGQPCLLSIHMHYFPFYGAGWVANPSYQQRSFAKHSAERALVEVIKKWFMVPAVTASCQIVRCYLTVDDPERLGCYATSIVRL